MKMKNFYFLWCIFFICFINNVCSANDELEDFVFGDEKDSEIKEVKLVNKVMQKETSVRGTVLRALRRADTRNELAQSLPILRVMTPPQRLALATLVTNQVLTPEKQQGLTLRQVNNMFRGNATNTTSELMLPIALDIANTFRKARNVDMKESPAENEVPTAPQDTVTAVAQQQEDTPEAQELRGVPGQVVHVHRLGGPRPMRKPPQGPYRRNIVDKPPPRKPPMIIEARENDCEQFTNGICLESSDYPMEPIMTAIRRNKVAMVHLLAEYRDINNVTSMEGIQHEDYNQNRRTGDDDKGFMCPSTIKYARPKKARATSGTWKYIVNTADHTQTLRLEKCLKPMETCSYLTDNFRSRCVQVFNYHRLLTWDKTNGLHMDIFKVPTCCSCHIEGYKVLYPPDQSSSIHHRPSSFPDEEFDSVAIPTFDDDDDPNIILHNQKFGQGNPSFGEPKYEISGTNPFPKPKGPGKRPNFNSFEGANIIPDINIGSGSNRFQTFKSPTYNFDQEGTSGITISDPTEEELSHYLEAPRPHFTKTQKPNFGKNYKRGTSLGGTPPFGRPNSNHHPPGYKRGPPKRRRPAVYRTKSFDQEAYGSDIDENIYDTYTSTENYPEQNTENVEGHEKDMFTKRVNYNYHPIIDFFEPAQKTEAQKRIDAFQDDGGGWRPMTSTYTVTPRRNVAQK